MMLNHLFEDVFTDRLKNEPKLVKMLSIAMKHDDTLPSAVFGALGVNPSPERTIEIWAKLLAKMNNFDGRPLSADGKFYGWVTKIYAAGSVNWENLYSRARDHIDSYYLLQRRNLLKPAHMDLNAFGSYGEFETAMTGYRGVLKKIKEEERIKNLTKDAKSITILDNDKYVVVVPLNYGASCKFARSEGEFANWCTGTTSSDHYFGHYSRQGPLVIFYAKDDPRAKYQLHAPSDQFKDIKDEEINRKAFAQKYPDAMNDIVNGLMQHVAELGQHWKGMDQQISLFKSKFASAFGANI